MKAEDSAGSVDLKELLKLFPANGLSKAFAKYDADGSGGIDKSELEAALKTLPRPKSVKMGKKVPLEELFATMATTHVQHPPWYEPNQAMVRTMRTTRLFCSV